jgi:hypothetical protein
MNVRLLLTLLMSAGVFLVANTAFAQTEAPKYCDPSTDPDQCDCPGGSVYDTCTQVSVSNLDEVSDAQDLRNAANISSSWNSNLNAWDVTIDAEALAAPGVLKMDQYDGTWSSYAELYDFIGDLIGQSLSPQDYDGDGSYDLPRLNIDQKGTTHRLDTTSGEWVRSTGSLFWDAITTRSGKLCINSVCTDIFASPEPEYKCKGDDANAADSDQDGALKGDACSHAARENTGKIPDNDCREDFGQDKCALFADFARTKLQTAPTENGVRFNPWCVKSSSPVCDLTEPITVPRIEADKITVENSYFDFYNFTRTGSNVELNAVDAVEESTMENGVCAKSVAEDGNELVVTNTADGFYDASSGGPELCSPFTEEE